jgi:hypothetical protein
VNATATQAPTRFRCASCGERFVAERCEGGLRRVKDPARVVAAGPELAATCGACLAKPKPAGLCVDCKTPLHVGAHACHACKRRQPGTVSNVAGFFALLWLLVVGGLLTLAVVVVAALFGHA